MLGHVERAGPERRISGLLVERAVEARKLHIAELVRDAVQHHLLHASRRRLLLKLDLVADDGDPLARGAGGIAARNDLQHHLGALRTANLLDGLAHRLVQNILHRTIALRHADNLVAALDPLVAVDRSALHHLDDLERPLVHGEHRAHAAERKRHVHVEILLARRRHVVGMRIVGLADRAHVALKHHLLVRLGEYLHVLAIALEEVVLGRELGFLEIVVLLLIIVLRLLLRLFAFCFIVLRLLLRLFAFCFRRLLILGILVLLRLFLFLLVGLLLVELAVQHDGEHLVLDALAPDLILLLARRRPGGVLAPPLVILVHGKVELRAHEQIRDEIDALGDAFKEKTMHVIHERDVTGLQRIVDLRLHRGETVDVRLAEHHPGVVVVRNKICPGAPAHLIVERTPQHMLLLQTLDQFLRHLAVVRLRREH